MGVGKSTIGSKLSKIMNAPFVDIDEVIEDNYGISISKIFNKYGEDYFRKIESGFLEKIINENEEYILSTGGGIVLDKNNRLLLKNNGIVIWLDCSIDELFKRLGNSDNRPLLANKEKLKETLINLANKRNHLYKEIADIYIDTSNKTINEIIRELLENV